MNTLLNHPDISSKEFLSYKEAEQIYFSKNSFQYAINPHNVSVMNAVINNHLSKLRNENIKSKCYA